MIIIHSKNRNIRTPYRILQYSLSLTPAPASRDAKFCVSRATTVYHHRHIITHTHCTYLLVRRKILRLYFSSDTNSNQHSSPLNRNAPACRDAKSCVSRATHHKHKQSTTHRFKAHFLLVRRKILRLYFPSNTNSNQHSSPLNRDAPACRDAKSCVSRATRRNPYTFHNHLFNYTFISGDARFCVSTLANSGY